MCDKSKDFFVDNFKVPQNFTSYKTGKINKDRWLQINFPAPKTDTTTNTPKRCGDADYSCEPDTDKLHTVNYFVIWKLTPTDPKHKQIVDAIANSHLSFDAMGHLGAVVPDVKGVGSELSDDEIIIKNPTISSSNSPKPYLDYISVIPNTNKNGKLTLNSAFTYILYNDVTVDQISFDTTPKAPNLSNGNFYLLYNPIQRKSFFNNYFTPCKDIQGAGLDLDQIYQNYCYSTASIATDSDNSRDPGDWYFGDVSCNCFCPPTALSKWTALNDIQTNAASETSTTTPLILSSLYTKNIAFWQNNLNLPGDLAKSFYTSAGNTNAMAACHDKDICVTPFLPVNQKVWDPQENSFIGMIGDKNQSWFDINSQMPGGSCSATDITINFCEQSVVANDADNTILNNTNFSCNVGGGGDDPTDGGGGDDPTDGGGQGTSIKYECDVDKDGNMTGTCSKSPTGNLSSQNSCKGACTTGDKLVYVCNTALGYICIPTTVSSGEENPLFSFMDNQECEDKCKDPDATDKDKDKDKDKTENWWSWLMNLFTNKDKFETGNTTMCLLFIFIIIFIILIVLFNLLILKNFKNKII